MQQTFWILTVKGRWHAWHAEAQRSVCGVVTAQSLQEHPPKEVITGAHALLPEQHALACKACRRKLGLSTIVPAVDESVRAWEGYVQRHLSRVHARLAGPASRMLAELLAEVGHPDDPAAREVWEEMRGFLLTPWRSSKQDCNGKKFTLPTLPSVGKALGIVPRGTHALQGIARALRTWRSVAGLSSYGRYHAEQVVQAMLEVPDIEAYVRHLKNRGLDSLAAMFHPNTLARAKREPALRGVFAGSSTYWEATKDQLNIVEE